MTHPDPQKSISDQELDALLQEVPVPNGLQEKLLELPGTINEPASEIIKEMPGSPKWLQVFVLAASVAGISAFLTWAINAPKPDTGRVANQGSIIEPDNPIDDATAVAELTLSKISSNEATFESAMARLEIEALQNRLKALETSQPAEFNLSTRDYHSMITALSDQVVIQLGGSEETVRSDMVQVINQYPDSMGAKIAERFLNTQTN